MIQTTAFVDPNGFTTPLTIQNHASLAADGESQARLLVMLINYGRLSTLDTAGEPTIVTLSYHND